MTIKPLNSFNDELLKIYHGSFTEIPYPEIRTHRYTKDFSWGFYCTKIQAQAEKWASKFISPIVNVYSVKDLESLNVKHFDDYCDEWLELRFSNQFEKDFEEITDELKDYKYKKYRLEEVYPNDFLVRFDLRELS